MNQTRADPYARILQVDTKKMRVRAVISTNEPDRRGDIVVPKGLHNFKEFMFNPVVLWAHQRSLPPIGVCDHLEVEADRIVAETRFSSATQLARDAFKLYAEGVLRGWSIGFIPLEVYPIRPNRGQPRGGTCFQTWDLVEYSAVPIPENPMALTLAVKKGMVKDPDLANWLIQDVLGGLL
jgi:hypothetical protein